MILCWAGHDQNQTCGNYTLQRRWETPPLSPLSGGLGQRLSPLCICVMSTPRGETPAAVGWEKLGVSANYKAVWRLPDADGQWESWLKYDLFAGAQEKEFFCLL